MINILIKLLSSGGDFNKVLVLKLVFAGASLLLSVISVFLIRKYFIYDGKYIGSFGNTEISSKGWFIVTALFGFWGAIACLVATLQSVKNLPKTCNNCGTVTKNQFAVCRNCLSKDNFTLDNSEKKYIDEKFKIPAIVLTVISTVTYIAGSFIHMLFI